MRTKRTPEGTDSLHAERTRKEHWLAEKHRLEAEQMAGRLVDVEVFARQWDHVFVELKRTVRDFPISEEQKFAILEKLYQVLEPKNKADEKEPNFNQRAAEAASRRKATPTPGPGGACPTQAESPSGPDPKNL